MFFYRKMWKILIPIGILIFNWTFTLAGAIPNRIRDYDSTKYLSRKNFRNENHPNSYWDNIEMMLSMKDPTHIFRSGVEEINKYSLVNRMLDSEGASEEHELESLFNFTAIKDGISLIESALYECSFNVTGDDSIFCKPKMNVIRDSVKESEMISSEDDNVHESFKASEMNGSEDIEAPFEGSEMNGSDDIEAPFKKSEMNETEDFDAPFKGLEMNETEDIEEPFVGSEMNESEDIDTPFIGSEMDESEDRDSPFKESEHIEAPFKRSEMNESEDIDISESLNDVTTESAVTHTGFLLTEENDIADALEIDKVSVIENISMDESFRSYRSGLSSFLFNNPLSQPEQKFQNCTTPSNETGNCMYIHHCLIPSILNNLNQLLQYLCIIEGSFIGVCCPEYPVTIIDVNWKDVASGENVSAANSSQPDPECGIAQNTRIVGGSNADRKAWPWMVALLARSKEAFFCGGSLINTRYVLTAAHCTFGVPKNEITARVGEYDLKAPVHIVHEDYAVVRIKRHGQYSQRTLQNDIALLMVEKPVTFNNFIKTICLPEKNFDYVNRSATLAGWGNLEGGGPTSDVLQVASFPVISNNDCGKDHGVDINNSTICTGSDNKGACNGDSGGPLMLLDDNDRWKIVALVSWGRRGCSPKFPTVYTRVSFYLDWIREHSRID